MIKATNLVLVAGLTLASCNEEAHRVETELNPVEGTIHTVMEKPAIEMVRASAVAEPYAKATLSTKLMGTVVAVAVHEGDRVRQGQPLMTIDARELHAKDLQIGAGIAEAEAVRQEAAKHAQRMHALHAEEAATRAQLDAAETGLARAEAAVRSARAAREELNATRGYAIIRAPFTGIITARMVDPGAFATPGAPLANIQDARRLRLVGTAAPASLSNIRRGAEIDVEIEGAFTRGVVEAVVPSSGNLYHVNVIVDNSAASFLPGSAAAILLPQGSRSALRIPEAAIHRAGDLTGVYIRHGDSTRLRWVQLGERIKGEVEVLAGLRAGERIVIPTITAKAQ